MSTKRTALSLLATVTMTAGMLLLGSSTANAEDTRPCVSKAEFYGLGHKSATRVELEARWEVANVAIDAGRGDYRYFVSYPFCGYSPSAAFVTVSYRYDTQQWVTELLTRVEGAKPHGHEAHVG